MTVIEENVLSPLRLTGIWDVLLPTIPPKFFEKIYTLMWSDIPIKGYPRGIITIHIASAGIVKTIIPVKQFSEVSVFQIHQREFKF
jgi:hypothetical protein